MLAVGDAALRVGEARRSRDATPTARQAYLIALFRARDRRSVGGLLRTAKAFASLDDEEVVAPALHLAERLATEQNASYIREAATRIRSRLHSIGRL